MEGRTVEHSTMTLTHLVLPQLAGRAGYAHGGEIMKLMDTAAGVVGIRHAHTDLVTARVEGVNFYRPIKVWDLVIINAYLTFVGRSTMEVRVEVFREDVAREKREHALTAYFIMVALDEEGRPTEVPPLLLSSDRERELWEQGKRRYLSCRGDIMADDAGYKVCREEPVVFE